MLRLRRDGCDPLRVKRRLGASLPPLSPRYLGLAVMKGRASAVVTGRRSLLWLVPLVVACAPSSSPNREERVWTRAHPRATRAADHEVIPTTAVTLDQQWSKLRSPPMQAWTSGGRSLVRRRCKLGPAVVEASFAPDASLDQRWSKLRSSPMQAWTSGGRSFVRRRCKLGPAVVEAWCVADASLDQRWSKLRSPPMQAWTSRGPSFVPPRYKLGPAPVQA